MKSITLCIIECRFVPFVPSFNFQDYHLGGFCSLLQTLFLTFEFNLYADLIRVLDNIRFLMIFHYCMFWQKFWFIFQKLSFWFWNKFKIFFSWNSSSFETNESFETETVSVWKIVFLSLNTHLVKRMVYTFVYFNAE